LPGYNWRRWKHPTPLTSRGIADQTLSIRIYGVDCPELAKFGKPSQPYGPEAKEHTSRVVLHRVVRITLLRKDQYRRAVAQVQTVPSRFFSWIPLDVFRPKDVSVELASAGLAELYTGGGAEYCVRTNNSERSPAVAIPQSYLTHTCHDNRTIANCSSDGSTGPSARAGGCGRWEISGCRPPTTSGAGAGATHKHKRCNWLRRRPKLPSRSGSVAAGPKSSTRS
jgi:Staphylococcal nuclease homologue